jgi:hypothetical protein
MAHVTILPNRQPAKLTGTVVLHLSPEEAHALMLTLGEICGPMQSVRTYLTPIHGALEEVTGLGSIPGSPVFHDNCSDPAWVNVWTKEQLAQLGTLA